MSNVANGQGVKGPFKHNGTIHALIQTHAKATYISKLDGKSWSAQVKLMGYADPAWVTSISPTVNQNNLIVIAPKISNKRKVALYMSESAIKP